MGNLSGTPKAPANPANPTAPASPKSITGSVSPKAVGAPAAPKNAAAPQTPTNATAPALPGSPRLPKRPTGASNPAAPAKPSHPSAPTGKGIHFGGRRKKRTRKKQRGGYKIQYNKQREYGPFTKKDFTIGESVIIKGNKKREGFITSIQPSGVQLSRRLGDGRYQGVRFYGYNEIKSVRRVAQKKKPKSAAKTRGGRRGRRRSRKKRNRRSARRRRRHIRGAGILDFFKDTKKKKQTRKEKEEREERNKDAIAEQRFKLRLAAAAEKDYLASTKQEGIPNIERMTKMRTAARTAWEHFMSTDKYQTFLYETWKVNWGNVPPTAEEIMLLRSLKRYDPAGYRAVQQRTFIAPRQQGGKRRRKTHRRRRRR